MFFNMGDSHGGAIELGLHRAVMGKMEFAGLQRSTCPWGPFNQCRQDRPGDAQEYHAAVNKLLVQNLRPGDVVSIIGVNNGHLNSDMRLSTSCWSKTYAPEMSYRSLVSTTAI